MKPYKIGLSIHYGPLWMNEHVVAESEDEAIAKYNRLKEEEKGKGKFCPCEEAVNLWTWFPYLEDWDKIKDKVENIDGIFAWPE